MLYSDAQHRLTALHQCTTASFASSPKCLQASCVHYAFLRSAEELFAIEKNGSPTPQQQEDRQ